MAVLKKKLTKIDAKNMKPLRDSLITGNDKRLVSMFVNKHFCLATSAPVDRLFIVQLRWYSYPCNL